MKNGRVLFLRSMALALALAFTGQDILFAAPEAAAALQNLTHPLVAFDLPQSFGTVEDSWRGDAGAPKIILFQDAHTNPSGQKNLARALDLIAVKENLTHVFVEGQSGDLSVAALKDYFSRDVLWKTGEWFINKSDLKGSELANLTSEKSFVLWGIEDQALYAKALEAYRKAAAGRTPALALLDRIERSLETLKAEFYSDDLQNIDRLKKSYDAGLVPLTEYFIALDQAAGKAGISLTVYPELRMLKKLKAREDSIDFTLAAQQEEAAIAALPRSSRQEALALKSPLAKVSRAAQEDARAFFFYLEEKITHAKAASGKEPSRKKYSELFKYIDYLRVSQRLKAGQALQELKSLEETVFETLAQTPDAQGTVLLSRGLDLEKKLLSLQIAPDEYRALKASPQLADSRIQTGFINKKVMDLRKHYDQAVRFDKTLADAVTAADAFYQTTFERDQAFFKNLSAHIVGQNLRTAALVTGGFHAPHLKEMLRSRGWSYVSVIPSVYHATDFARYERLLLVEQNRARTSSVPTRLHPASATPTLDIDNALRLNSVQLERFIASASQLAGVRPAGVEGIFAGARMALPSVDPRSTSAWTRLQSAFARIKGLHLRELFATDPKRAERFTHVFRSGDAEIVFDLSKNRMDAETMSGLQQLADETQVARATELMFAGDRINATEDRAVLHAALRAPANAAFQVDGENVMPDVHQVLEHMRVFSDAVNSGSWTGYTGKPITDIVNIGIGGSDLGPVMVTEALKSYRTGKVNVHFVSNVDGTDITEKVFKKLDPETTLFIIASKTFTTQETMTNAQSARKWFLERAGDVETVKKHFVALSTNKEAVEKFGIDSANMFEFWDWVGGRYSLWSAIGLSVAIYVGFDNFKELLAGAHDMDEHFRTAPFDQNIPVQMGLLSVWYTQFFGAQTHAVLPYDQYLHRLPAYLQQAAMESNGKGTDRNGNPIDYMVSPIVFGEAGTNGQHSFYQLLHQGQQMVPADFIGVTQSQNPIGDHQAKLLSNFLAQTQALAFGKTQEAVRADGVQADIAPHRAFPGNNPTTSILINRLTPRALGALIAMYEHQIFVEGVVLNVYSFDQWGVELGKVQAGPILNDLTGGASVSQDGSTAALIRHIKETRLSERFAHIAKETQSASEAKERWSDADLEIIQRNVLDWLAADDAIVPSSHKQAIRNLLDTGDAAKLKGGFLNADGIQWPGTAGFRGPMENLEQGLIGPNYIGEVLMRQYADIYRSYLADQQRAGKLVDQPYAIVAGEVRLNTELYTMLLARGIAQAGFRVVRHADPTRRPVSTPLTSHAAQYFGKKNGAAPAVVLMNSASHNGLKDSGVKIGDSTGCQLLPNQVAELKPFKRPLSQIVPFEDEASLREKGLISDMTAEDYEALLTDYFDATEEALQPDFADVIRQAVHGGMKFVTTPLNGATGEETLRFLTERLGLERDRDFFVPEDEMILPMNDRGHAAWTYKDFDPARKGILDKTIAYAESRGIGMVFARDLDGDRIVVAVKTDGAWKLLDGNQNGIVILEDKLAALDAEGRIDDIANFVLMRSHVTTPLLDAIAGTFGVSKENIGVVPVGFKYFGAVIKRKLGQWKRRYFGAEESYGLSAGVDPEKDSLTGLVSLLLVAAKAYGRMNIYEKLLQIYEQYGYTGDITTKFDIQGADPAERDSNKKKTLAALSGLQAGDTIGDRFEVDRTDHKFRAPLYSPEELQDGYRLYLTDKNTGRKILLIIRASGTEPVFKYAFFWVDPVKPQSGKTVQDVINFTGTYLTEAGGIGPSIEAFFTNSWSAATGARLSAGARKAFEASVPRGAYYFAERTAGRFIQIGRSIIGGEGSSLRAKSKAAVTNVTVARPFNAAEAKRALMVLVSNLRRTAPDHPVVFTIDSDVLGDFDPAGARLAYFAERMNVHVVFSGKYENRSAATAHLVNPVRVNLVAISHAASLSVGQTGAVVETKEGSYPPIPLIIALMSDLARNRSEARWRDHLGVPQVFGEVPPSDAIHAMASVDTRTMELLLRYPALARLSRYDLMEFLLMSETAVGTSA